MHSQLSVLIFTLISSIHLSFSPPPILEKENKTLIESLHFKKGEKQLFLSAHRGGRFIHNLPENAIPTFDHTLHLTPSAIIEMDVAITKDGQLILMHDKSLDRTTTTSGIVAQKDWADFSDAKLVDDYGIITPYFIPTFEEVLSWAKKRDVILKVDIKRGVPYQKVIKTIEKFRMGHQVILITYTMSGAEKAYALTKKMMISVTIRNMEEWKRFIATGIPARHIIAFTGTRMSDPKLYKTLHKHGILCILGTMGNIDKKAKAKGRKIYHNCLASGIDMLATDEPVACMNAVNSFKD